ncbi:endoribonuclease L-PSP [Fusarium coicis]|nr:endoribonuclease L-PSP [Fusarium coicis]
MKFIELILLLTFPSIAASLSKRDCESFDLTNPGPNGWSRTGQPIRVSEIVNCTAERAKENGDGKGNCNIQRYKMGIIANATINSTDGATYRAPSPANLNTSMANKNAIINAVKGSVNLSGVTLERLVVIPFTVPSNTTPNGTYGYWTFTPEIRCWRGYQKDCDGDLEEDLNGNSAVVCGFRLKSNPTDGNGTTYAGNVSFVEEDEEDGLTKYEVRPWPEYQKARQIAAEWDRVDIRVTELVNCTAERANEKGDNRGNCRIQRSKIGIIANSTITKTNNEPLDTSLENKKIILEAVRDVADSKAMEYVNLQQLAVIPYRNSYWAIPKGKRGYWVWAPDMNCWPGALNDCGNDDDLDDTEVVVCGFRIDTKGSNESDAEYRGRVGFGEDNDPKSRIKPGVRPWPDYEDDVERA